MRQAAQTPVPVRRSLLQEARQRIQDAKTNFSTSKLADGKLVTQNKIDPAIPVFSFEMNNKQVLASTCFDGLFAQV